MFSDFFRSKPKQEIVQFNPNLYAQFLSDADRVILEDLKEEAQSQTLTEQQTKEILRISNKLASNAADAGLPASSDDIARFIREFYQSMVAAERSKNIAIDSEKFQKFTELLESEDLKILDEIRIGAEQYGTLSPADNNRISLIKQHFTTAVERAGYDFTKAEVESYIDELVAPRSKESASIAPEPEVTYRVNRVSSQDTEIPDSRFDRGDTPLEDLR